jgi:hypothetical protein
MTTTIPIEHGAIETTIHESHKRGRNWAAVLVGPNAARMERQFMRRRGRVIDVSDLKVGDAFEVGGDYISSGGNRSPNRAYYVITEMADDHMVVETYDTAAQAIKAARTLAPEDLA